MFVSINEYRNSLNESVNPNFVRLKDSILEFFNEYPDATFDVRLFEDLEQYGITVEYIHMGEQELNNYLEQFGIFIASYDDESIEFQLENSNMRETMTNEMASAFQEKAIRAIEKANDLGFNFNIEQRRSTVFFYTQPIGVGNVQSIDYDLLNTSGSWRVMAKINHTLPEDPTVSTTNLDRAAWNQSTGKTFVCMFSID